MKIAILDDWSGTARDCADWAGLERDLGADITVFRENLSDHAALAEFDVICIMRERMPFDADAFAALPALKLLVTTGPRNLSIDLDAARAAGVTVWPSVPTPGVRACPVRCAAFAYRCLNPITHLQKISGGLFWLVCIAKGNPSCPRRRRTTRSRGRSSRRCVARRKANRRPFSLTSAATVTSTCRPTRTIWTASWWTRPMTSPNWPWRSPGCHRWRRSRVYEQRASRRSERDH